MFSTPIGELDRSSRGKRGAHAATVVQEFGVVGQDEEDESGKKKNRSAPPPNEERRNASSEIANHCSFRAWSWSISQFLDAIPNYAD